jgi:hypothetical protein
MGMRRIAWLVFGCFVGCGQGGGPTFQEQLPAYLAGDVCHGRADAAACAADARCQWFALGIACRDGAPCLSGVCQERDPCAALDEAACGKDATCMWAGAVTALCPPGATCPEKGGFCTRRPADGCACACPLYCPQGEDCPPCACDCSGGGSGGSGSGGTCSCTCAPCPVGLPCPLCACDCASPPTCPADAGTAPGPCAAHSDEKSCLEDTADHCAWAAILAPCREGEPCPTGSCYERAMTCP